MKMKTKYSVIADALRGESRSICIGRSSNRAGFGTNTPIRVVSGNSKPKLVGKPYLKTGFNNGRGFSTVLYTPSTLCVGVGADWLENALRTRADVYNNDNH